MSEVKTKFEFFNSYLAVHCTPLVKNCQLATRFTTYTGSVLMSIDFSVEKISNIIKKLDSSKVMWGFKKTSY